MAWTTSGEEAAVSDAASRRARGDVLYDRDGALADQRDRRREGTHAVHATQGAASEALDRAHLHSSGLLDSQPAIPIEVPCD